MFAQRSHYKWQIHRSKCFCQPSAQTHNYQISSVCVKYCLGWNVDEHNLLITIILFTSCKECIKIKILWIKVSSLTLDRNNELSTVSSAPCKTCRGNLSYSRLATTKLLDAVLTSMKLGLSLFLQLNDGSVHSCMSSLCTRWHPWWVWPVTIRRGFNISISWK